MSPTFLRQVTHLFFFFLPLSGLSDPSGESEELVLGDGHDGSSISSTVLLAVAPSTSGAPCTLSLALLAGLLRAVVAVFVIEEVDSRELVSVLLVRMRLDEAVQRQIKIANIENLSKNRHLENKSYKTISPTQCYTIRSPVAI